MDAEQYAELALKTKLRKFASAEEEIGYWALCLAGEAGEVANRAKKIWKHGHPLTKLEVTTMKDELGDVLWYLTVLAESMGVTLDDIMQHNLQKLNDRYPEGFSEERSINRDESHLR